MKWRINDLIYAHCTPSCQVFDSFFLFYLLNWEFYHDKTSYLSYYSNSIKWVKYLIFIILISINFFINSFYFYIFLFTISKLAIPLTWKLETQWKLQIIILSLITITFGEGKEVCHNDKYESFPTRKAFFLNKQNKMSAKK